MAVVYVRWRLPVVASAGMGTGLGTHNSRRGSIWSWDSNRTRRCRADLVMRGQTYAGAAIADFRDRAQCSVGDPNWDCAFADGNTIEIRKVTFLFFSIARATYRLEHCPARGHKSTLIGFGLGLDYFRFTATVRNTRAN
ncbi:MAG: hypothetical protein MJA83_13770 [Gammaproteobacteria bacterium]|nr:hypothetical protein [Gammaproteobacteria bacterium]